MRFVYKNLRHDNITRLETALCPQVQAALRRRPSSEIPKQVHTLIYIRQKLLEKSIRTDTQCFADMAPD